MTQSEQPPCETCHGVRHSTYEGTLCIICKQAFCFSHFKGHECKAMKVFNMNDCDWFMARSLEEAIYEYKKYLKSQDMDDEPEYWEDAVELTEEEMDRLKYRDEDLPEAVTFREALAMRGSEPEFFASTEY